jgi:hypothetical protein
MLGTVNTAGYCIQLKLRIYNDFVGSTLTPNSFEFGSVESIMWLFLKSPLTSTHPSEVVSETGAAAFEARALPSWM